MNIVANGITARYGKGTDSDGTDSMVFQCQGSNVGPMGTLRKGNGNETGGVPFVAHTLRAEGADASEDGTGRGTPLVAFAQKQDGHVTESPIFNSITTEQTHASARACAKLRDGSRVRRLTPRECERLQGFPDDHTLVEGTSNSARYRQCGNAVAVPVAQWIGERLIQAAVLDSRATGAGRGKETR